MDTYLFGLLSSITSFIIIGVFMLFFYFGNKIENTTKYS